MVMVNEYRLVNETELQPGRLGARVERDLADALNEYGAPATGEAPERGGNFPVANFAYGIPMAGVRYYSFVCEQ